VLSSQGKIDEAAQEFQKAIALRPKFWGGYNDLGYALFTAGRHEQAAKAFEQVVALQPDSYIGFQQLGTIYQSLGDSRKAIDAYERSIAIRPSFGVYSNLGVLHHMARDYQRAIDAYQLAIGLRPNAAVLYRNLGDSFTRAGRSEEGRTAYLKAVQLAEKDLEVNPNDPRRLASLAVYLVKAGQPDAALRRLARARDLNPLDGQVLFRSAVVHALMGRTDAALSDIASAIDRGYSVRAIQEEEDFTALQSNQRFRDLTRVPTTR
jgi:tetratricopeptide (TPR) repeat protein